MVCAPGLCRHPRQLPWYASINCPFITLPRNKSAAHFSSIPLHSNFHQIRQPKYRHNALHCKCSTKVLTGFIAVNKAFQYTSITSVTILDCWTVAWAMILTWIFLGAKYSPWQFVGAGICVGGLGLVLLSDAGVGGGGEL